MCACVCLRFCVSVRFCPHSLSFLLSVQVIKKEENAALLINVPWQRSLVELLTGHDYASLTAAVCVFDRALGVCVCECVQKWASATEKQTEKPKERGREAAQREKG